MFCSSLFFYIYIDKSLFYSQLENKRVQIWMLMTENMNELFCITIRTNSIFTTFIVQRTWLFLFSLIKWEPSAPDCDVVCIRNEWFWRKLVLAVSSMAGPPALLPSSQPQQPQLSLCINRHVTCPPHPSLRLLATSSPSACVILKMILDHQSSH